MLRALDLPACILTRIEVFRLGKRATRHRPASPPDLHRIERRKEEKEVRAPRANQQLAIRGPGVLAGGPC